MSGTKLVTFEAPPLDAILAIHAALLEKFGSAPGLRDEGAVEAALNRPHNPLAYGDEKISVASLAASIAYSLAHIRHPFVDGNKRIGFAALIVTLEMNGLTLDVGERHAANIMTSVSSGDMSEQDFAAWAEIHSEPL